VATNSTGRRPRRPVSFLPYMNTAAISPVLISLIILISGCVSNSADEQERWDITAQTDFGRQPRWSPLGGTILFGDDTPGRTGLWLWQPGQSPQPAADSLPAHNWDYRWSPDGSRIAFTCPGEAGADSSGIWIISVDDGTLSRIYDRGRDVCWSPGSDSVVVRVDHPTSGAAGIYAVDGVSGRAELRVSGGFKPICSPKLDWLAFSDGEINGQLHLAGGDLSKIVTGAGANQWEWSGDGRLLFCVVNNYPSDIVRGDVWRIAVNGDSVSVDTAIVSWAAYPAPDATGGQVAMQRTSTSRWVGVWIYRASEGEVQIADYGQNPSFDPTGDRVAVNANGGGIRVLTRVK